MPNLGFLGDYSLLITAVAAALLAAFWLSLVIWTFRDIRRRSRDVFTRILAVLLVLLLFLPGFLIYLILRPSTTLEEEYQRTLEEEALLRNIEDVAQCPGCNRRIQPDWMVCPSCHTLLKKHCPSCGKLMELPWNICPYCATPVPGVRLENVTTADLAGSEMVEEARGEDDSPGATDESTDSRMSLGWINLPRPDDQATSTESLPPGG